MKRGHVPVRQCIACRRRRPARELIRFEVEGNCAVVSERKENRTGRGCYVCPSEDCIKEALNAGRLGRALRKTIVSVPPAEGLLDRLERKGKLDDNVDRG